MLHQGLDCTAMFPKMWPDEEVLQGCAEISDECSVRNTSTTSTMMDDEMSLVSSGLDSTGSYVSTSVVSLKDLSIARGSTPQVQENLKRFGDWNETVKYSQRCAARQELRRRARTAAAQVETFMQERLFATTHMGVKQVLGSQCNVHAELNDGQKDEDKEDMDFMSIVSAQSALSAESRISAQASVLRSNRSETSRVSSLSGSQAKCAGKAHSKGFDPKPEVTPKQQLARRRLSLYLQSGDPFRPISSVNLDQPAKLQDEPVAMPCDATKVKDTSWKKHCILVFCTVLVLTSVTVASQLINHYQLGFMSASCTRVLQYLPCDSVRAIQRT